MWFHFHNNVSQRTEILNFGKIQFFPLWVMLFVTSNNNCSFTVSLKNQVILTPNFVLFGNYLLTMDHLPFHSACQFLPIGIFIINDLNIQINLWKTDMSVTLRLFIHEYGKSLHLFRSFKKISLINFFYFLEYNSCICFIGLD